MKRPKTVASKNICRRAFLAGLSGATLVPWAAHADSQPVRIGYIRWTERRPTISLLDMPPPNDGLAGAQMALEDNNTTGRFLGQSYDLTDVPVGVDDDIAAALGKLIPGNIVLVLTDVPADRLLRLADAGRDRHVTVFNVGAPDDALRQEECRADIIHVAPTRSMLADAVAQYLVWKKWTRWLLVYGSHPNDALLADAYRRAAKRFGARIVQERVYKDTDGARQTDSGIVQTQQQLPVFTQDAPAYDVLVAADEDEVFAGYLSYRTWDPRPVAGSAGLRPVTWDPSSESWGGKQMQDRFIRRFRRLMTPRDLQAWTAVRMIGEAASRTQSADPAAILAYMKRPDFVVAAYKGEGLSIRPWDHQVRQPVFLSDGRNVVSVSPQPGFLHQVTDLDTLGIDRPESRCTLK